MIVDIFNTNNTYDIIYADPPWQYTNNHTRGSAENHYQTMLLEDIKGLHIDKLSKPNSVLFMWATFPMLPDALELINSWGFTYKTVGFNWVKWNKNKQIWFMGLGNYTRSNPEICLLGVKGRGLKRIRADIGSVINYPVMKHSKKPDIVRNLIAELFGSDCTKLELFARQEFRGWDCWGNEV